MYKRRCTEIYSKRVSTSQIEKSELEWKNELSEAQYRILRKKGTEMPHSGAYNLHFENGVYHCAGCNTPLFESQTKFDAGCVWPGCDGWIKCHVEEILAESHGMMRTASVCGAWTGRVGQGVHV